MSPWWNYFIDYFFPSVCLACGKDRKPGQADIVCPTCKQMLWSEPPIRRFVPGADAIWCAGKFDPALRELILCYKYKGKDYLKSFFRDLCLQKWKFDAAGFDMVLPVPSSLWRTWQRGYNPAELLACEIALYLKKPIIRNMLRRKWNSPSQTRLSKNERIRNATDSFFYVRCANVRGKSILVVDDVITTGSTIKVCVDLLRKAGAQSVLVGAIAYEDLPSK